MTTPSPGLMQAFPVAFCGIKTLQHVFTYLGNRNEKPKHSYLGKAVDIALINKLIVRGVDAALIDAKQVFI